jgi:hypothetical protein
MGPRLLRNISSTRADGDENEPATSSRIGANRVFVFTPNPLTNETFTVDIEAQLRVCSTMRVVEQVLKITHKVIPFLRVLSDLMVVE